VDETGGFIGTTVNESANISFAYSVGLVNSSGNYTGGFIGRGIAFPPRYLIDFWDSDIAGNLFDSGISIDHPIYEISNNTTSQMKQQATYAYLNYTWDFVNVWQINETNSYPYFIWQDGPACREYFCGNWVVESGEECDDGNTLNGDGCNEFCQIESGVSIQPPTCSLNSSPSVLSGNQSIVNLTWSSSNAVNASFNLPVTITSGNVFNGSGTAIPYVNISNSSLTQTTTYVYTVSNSNSTVTCEVLVGVRLPLRCEFNPNTSVITIGDTVTLNWASLRAVNGTMTPSVVLEEGDFTNGSAKVSPTQNTTYYLTVFSLLGQSYQCSANVIVFSDTSTSKTPPCDCDCKNYVCGSGRITKISPTEPISKIPKSEREIKSTGFMIVWILLFFLASIYIILTKFEKLKGHLKEYVSREESVINKRNLDRKNLYFKRG